MSKRQLIAWLTAAYIALLTTFCLVKVSVPMPDLRVIGFDKLIHFGMYFVLNTLLILTIIAHKGKAAVTQIIATTIAAIAYGIAIEFAQQQGVRSFELYDIVANSIGAITAAAILANSKIKELIKAYLQT